MGGKGSNGSKNLVHFKKGHDPRRNLKGRPKALPSQKKLFEALLGVHEGEDLTKSAIAQIVNALVDEVKSKKPGAQRVAAAKEIFERIWGKVKSNESEEAPTTIIWNETKTYNNGTKNG